MFNIIGDVFDAVTDIGAAISPVVSTFNPGLGATLNALQSVDETVNKRPDDQQAASFESALGEASKELSPILDAVL